MVAPSRMKETIKRLSTGDKYRFRVVFTGTVTIDSLNGATETLTQIDLYAILKKELSKSDREKYETALERLLESLRSVQ